MKHLKENPDEMPKFWKDMKENLAKDTDASKVYLPETNVEELRELSESRQDRGKQGPGTSRAQRGQEPRGQFGERRL